MAASDEALQKAITALADASNGCIKFRVRNAKELGSELGSDLGGSKNPFYDFEFSPAIGPPFRTIAYTIIVDGSKRPATRVEALGRGLSGGEGRLFETDPFLIVFDYVGNQFMAVSAIALFGAFAREVAKRALASTETANFSLSPLQFSHWRASRAVVA